MLKKGLYDLAIGLTLRELHEERHIDREKLAELLELTDLGVTRIENGAERMSAGDLVLMLEAFDLEWDTFMGKFKDKLKLARSQQS